MSSVKIQGNASGTGILTIAAPNTNTDRTITLPDEAGTLVTAEGAGSLTGIPAFSAYLSANQSLTLATWEDIIFDIEDFDTNSWYDTSNGRFTPQIEGYYNISASALLDGTSHTSSYISLYKNGSIVRWLGGASYAATNDSKHYSGSITVYLNGSTDYITIRGYIASGSSPFVSASTGETCGISGHLVSKA